MNGESPESLAEARDVAERLLKNQSLHRLAENPLLLTMLLVVKHGAGRLPPDRVSLYDRAIEVLLDTWNIRGHESLNLKEAVPQLACIAFELLRKGKQTATESELLNILEEARERAPQIRRYAKDAPHEFLKRVELRSSLLVEAGHRLEGARTVPFYQFRHLTFQEHLAAVAAVGGHYLDYQKDDSVLTPLKPYLLAEEWKEVIPMAAVLARKQAEPLLAALVSEGDLLRQKIENDPESIGDVRLFPGALPPTIARLVQCLAEEAEPSSETLTAALQLVALFAKGCQSPDDWHALSCGPYGEELLHHTWLLYAPMRWPIGLWVRNTLALLASFRKPLKYWNSHAGQEELAHLLRSTSPEEVSRGLLTIAGMLWGKISAECDWLPLLKNVEAHLFSEDFAILAAAGWAWGRMRQVQQMPIPSRDALDRLLFLFLMDEPVKLKTGAYALVSVAGQPRESWTPILTDGQKEYFRELERMQRSNMESRRFYDLAASLMIGFHSKDVWPEEVLAGLLVANKGHFNKSDAAELMLKQMKEVGRKALEDAQPRKKQPEHPP
jgi:hypothetical protein